MTHLQPVLLHPGRSVKAVFLMLFRMDSFRRSYIVRKTNVVEAEQDHLYRVMQKFRRLALPVMAGMAGVAGMSRIPDNPAAFNETLKAFLALQAG